MFNINIVKCRFKHTRFRVCFGPTSLSAVQTFTIKLFPERVPWKERKDLKDDGMSHVHSTGVQRLGIKEIEANSLVGDRSVLSVREEVEG